MLTIAAIDEDTDEFRLIWAALAAEGHTVRRTARLAEAMAWIGDPAIDAVVVGACSEADGDTLTGELRRVLGTGTVPIIRLGRGSDDDQPRVSALNAGADVFLIPPVRGPELVAQIRALSRDRSVRADRVRMLAEAERLHSQLEAVFEAMSDGVIAFDVTGRVVLINRAQARMAGCDTPEQLMQDWDRITQGFELMALDGTPLPVEEWPLSRAMRGEMVRDIELRGLRRDTGREWYFRFSGGPIRDANGRQILTLIVTQDVTAQKQIEERLTEARDIAERHRVEQEAIVSSMTEGLVVFDPSGRLLDMNPAALAIHRFSSVEAVRMQLEGLTALNVLCDFEGRELPLEEWPISRALRGETFSGYEVQVFPTDGSPPWVGSYGGTPVYGPDGKMLVAIVTLRDITDQKRAEERLRQQEAALREAQRVAAVGSWEWDPASDAVSGSRELLRILGLDPSPGTLPPFREQLNRIYSEHDWHRVHQAMQYALRFGTSYELDVEAIRTDGALVWLTMRGEVVRDAQGNAITLRGTVQDITTRKRAEISLARQQQLTQGILDTIPVMITIYDPALQTFRFNEAFRQTLGWTEADAAGGSLLEKAYPDPAYREKVAGYMTSLTPGWQEFDVTAKDGTIVTSSWANIRLPDGSQVGIGLDVRQRKYAETALRESEERFRTYTETIPHLAFITDAVGTVVYSNRRFSEYFGLDSSQTRNWTWQLRQRAYHPADLAFAQEAWTVALTRGQPLEVEYRLRRFDGVYRWHLTRALPVLGASGKVEQWIATSTDISDQKQSEQELQRARDALARVNTDLEQKVADRTQRLRETVAELEHFSYTLTHDMRAPLRAMHGFGDILNQQYAKSLDATGRDYLRRIVQAAGRMDQLITDALNYGKVMRSEFPLQAVDPAALLNDMIESYPEFQRPQAEIIIRRPLPPLLANRAGLTQCFSNLLSNAVKFVAPGVVPCVRIRAEQHHDRVRLWFEDNGIGIPPGQQQRIFVMFQRLNTEYPGTGVGLALVQKVVERMRGNVGVEVTEGKGSRFWVEFARAPHARSL